MSLTGNQIKDLKDLYKSVYKDKEEDVYMTQEQFEDLCTDILTEAFEGSGIKIFDKTQEKGHQVTEGIRSTIMTIAKRLIKPTTVKGALTRGAATTIPAGVVAGVAGADIATGGTIRKTVGATVNNAIPFIKDMNTAVKSDKEFGGTILKDKESGTFSTADKTRKDLKKGVK